MKREKRIKAAKGWVRRPKRCATCRHFYYYRGEFLNPAGNTRVKVKRRCDIDGTKTHRGSWCLNYEEKNEVKT